MGSRSGDGQVSVWFVPTGGVDSGLAETAARATNETFPVDARVHPHPVDVSGFDGEEPYQGLDLAGYVRRETERDVVVAVTDADIEKPSGSPDFALARVGGSEAVVSTARLDGSGSATVENRLGTLAAKHVGYLLGMNGCSDEECLFNVSDTVADIDRVGPDPCTDCRQRMAGLDSRLLPPGHGDGDRSGRPDRSDARSETPNGGEQDSPNEVTHVLAGTARFSIAIGTFVVSLFLAALLLFGLVDLLPIVEDPMATTAGTWTVIAVSVVLAWVISGYLRRLGGWLGRRVLGVARGVLG